MFIFTYYVAGCLLEFGAYKSYNFITKSEGEGLIKLLKPLIEWPTWCGSSEIAPCAKGSYRNRIFCFHCTRSLRKPLLFQCPNYSLLLLASPDLACAHFLHAMFDLSMDLRSPSCVTATYIHTYETLLSSYWPSKWSVCENIDRFGEYRRKAVNEIYATDLKILSYTHTKLG